jgi:hypothetical protein
MKTGRILIIIVLGLNSLFLFSQSMGNEMYQLSQIRQNVKSKQVSSYDRTGGNGDCLSGIKDGAKFTIFDVKGAGVINRIWITIAPGAEQLNRNNILMKIYWDGNTFPSVESPIGPFFGNGWDESYNFVSVPLAVSPGAGKSYVSYFAMPFAQGARIEIENQTGQTIDAFYFNIEYAELARLPENSGRFHAWYNHEVTKALPDGENEWGLLGQTGKNLNGKDNYLFADIKGKGQFVGVNYYVNCPTTMWYGEGDEMVFIDGDSVPAFNGTGTEDFFNMSWCPKEMYQHLYFGFGRVNNETGWLGHTHVYRFFIADPVFFDKSCRFTIEHGHNNNLTLDLASVAYWYQDVPGKLPRSFTKEERQPKPLIGASEIHIWRHAWRVENKSGSQLWGDEK